MLVDVVIEYVSYSILLINLSFAYVAAIFVIIPINNAIDHAPARLQLIYSSSLFAVLIGVSYFLFSKGGPREVKITQEQLATLIPPKLNCEYRFSKLELIQPIPQSKIITEEQQDKLIQLIRNNRLREHMPPSRSNSLPSLSAVKNYDECI